MLQGSMVAAFIFLIWALVGLSGAHSGVGRVFRELENERELAETGSGNNEAA